MPDRVGTALPSVPGGYALVLKLDDPVRVKPGKLGTFELPAGHFLYMGSALSGLAPRLARHLRRHKKRHWHVDHLTTAIRPYQVWWVPTEIRVECDWTGIASSDPEASIPVPGFGSSDCRCSSHLVRVENEMALDRIWTRVSEVSPGTNRLDVSSA